jgi:hypothetical protein
VAIRARPTFAHGIATSQDEADLRDAADALGNALKDDRQQFHRSQQAIVQFRSETCMLDKGSGSMAF